MVGLHRLIARVRAEARLLFPLRLKAPSNHYSGSTRAALAIVTLLIVPFPAAAETHDATLIGTGPATTRGECPAGAVVVGVIAQVDKAVTLLVPECASVVNGFAWQSSGMFTTGSVGSSSPGAATQTATCEPGSFVVSLGANLLADPAAVGMLWIACQTSPASGAPRGGPVILPSNPGAATAGTGVSQCAEGEAATGIAGAATDTVGGVGLICTPLASFTAAPDAGMASAGAPGEVPGGDAAMMQPGGDAMASSAGPGDQPGMAPGQPGLPGEQPGVTTEAPGMTSTGGAGPGSDDDGALAAFDAAVNGAGQSGTTTTGTDTAMGGPGSGPGGDMPAMSGGPGSDAGMATMPASGGPGSDMGTTGGPGSDMGAAGGPGSGASTGNAMGAGSGGPGDPNQPSADLTSLQPVPDTTTTTTTNTTTTGAPDWQTLPTDKLSQSASLRDAPSMNSHILKAVPGGTLLHYSEHQKSWCHVFYDGGEGWISTNFIGCGLPKVAKSTKTKTKSNGSGGADPNTSPTAPPIFGTITLPNGIEIKIGP